eukprot:c17797_g1_i1.p1 GENE.c17797_g1_i1~~c17797_g1_i1.p1  ORF type:complete len:474 (+),score=124.34 c17797_g1_i1:861-2282(+)
MIKKPKSHAFEAELMLCVGEYEIRFQVDGEWRVSPELEIVASSDTIYNRLTVGAPPSQKQVMAASVGEAGFVQVCDPNTANQLRERWQHLITTGGVSPGRRSIEFLDLLKEGPIPPDLRGMLWPILAGSERVSHQLDYHLTLKQHEGQTSEAIDQIEKDLHRTLPDDPYFDPSQSQGEGHSGISKLQRVLTAYSWRNADVGYCQSMNKIAAVLLLFMNEEEAFWVLARLIEHYLKGYHKDKMLALHVDMRVLSSLMAQCVPKVFAHFQRLQIDIGLVALQWFLCVFVDALPPDCLFRVWDLVFCEGVIALFRTTIAICKLLQSAILNAQTPGELFDVFQNCEIDTQALVKMMYRPKWETKLTELALSKLREQHAPEVQQAMDRPDTFEKPSSEPHVVSVGRKSTLLSPALKANAGTSYRTFSFLVDHWTPPANFVDSYSLGGEPDRRRSVANSLPSSLHLPPPALVEGFGEEK